MLSTALVAAHGLVAPLTVLGAVACAAVGLVLLRAGDRGRRALAVLAVLAALAVLPLTLLPAGGGTAAALCTVQLAIPRPGAVEAVANIALLLPAALLGTQATGRPVAVLLGGVATSAAIETVQALAGGLGRACDTNDLAMNAIGVAVGVALGAGTRRLARRGRPDAGALRPVRAR